MRVNCREQIANPAEPVNGQDERRKCAAVDSPARLCCSVIKRATAQDAFCKTVIRHAAIDAARSIRSRRKREISLEYLIEEKHYPFSTTDKYFAEQSGMTSYPLFVCGQMVLLESPELAAAPSALDVYKRQIESLAPEVKDLTRTEMTELLEHIFSLSEVQRAVRHMAITHINQASRGKEQKADGTISSERHAD